MPLCDGPLLGVDYGFERTGLALSDPQALVAFPVGLLELHKYGKRSRLLDEIAAIALKNECKAVILGLPLHVDGTENAMCVSVRKIANKIGRRCNLPVFFMPETLSSEQAMDNLRAGGLHGDKLKAALDQEAARIILQSYLDCCHKGAGE